MMLPLVLRNNLRAVEIKDAAAIGGATSAIGGFLFFIFRFLVGASVADMSADMSADIKVLKSQMVALQKSIEAKDEKLDHLLLALAGK